MRKDAGILIATLLLLMLCACGTKSQTQQSGGKTDSSTHGYSSWYASNEGGVYIMRDGEFFPIDGFELSYAAMRGNYFDDIGMTYSDETNIPTLNLKNGEILITFDNVNSFRVNTASFVGFCFPIEVVNYASGIEFSGYGPVLDCEHYTPDELNGMEIKDKETFDRFLKDNGAYLYKRFITSDKATNFTAGYYRGTSFEEYSISLNARLFSIGESIHLAVEKTKDGYFIIDTANLPSGKCVLNIGEVWPKKYVINVIK